MPWCKGKRRKYGKWRERIKEERGRENIYPKFLTHRPPVKKLYKEFSFADYSAGSMEYPTND